MQAFKLNQPVPELQPIGECQPVGALPTEGDPGRRCDDLR